MCRSCLRRAFKWVCKCIRCVCGWAEQTITEQEWIALLSSASSDSNCITFLKETGLFAALLSHNYVFHLPLFFGTLYLQPAVLVKSMGLYLYLYYYFCCFSPTEFTVNKKQLSDKNMGDSSMLAHAVSMHLRPSLVCFTGVPSLSQYKLGATSYCWGYASSAMTGGDLRPC